MTPAPNSPGRARMRHASSLRMGLDGYLAVLAVMPGTVQQLAERCGFAVSGVRRLVRELRMLGVVFACGTAPAALRGQPRRVWHFGVQSSNARRAGAAPRPQVIAFASVITAMQCPKSVSELREETGMSHAAIRKIIAGLRAAGLSHISEWEQRQGCPIALHMLGSRPDAKRPRVKTRKEINAIQNPRQKAKRWMKRVMHAVAGTSERLGT